MKHKPEELPDYHSLYMRVHIALLKKRNYNLTDDVPPNIFREHRGSMSTDWCKYSSPEETRARKDPNSNGVIGMNVGEVKNIPPLLVKHAPKPNNRAHTDIIGANQERKYRTNEIRVKLARISKWLLKPLNNL